MAHKKPFCIYDSHHTLQICNKNTTESRSLNITITDFNEYLQIKVRDSSDFVFNYTTHIDSRQFEVMRSEQCLDIDFTEFRSNLIDMLHQVQKHEMFLKCDIGNDQDLQVTSNKEIFDEMNNNILELQSTNKGLLTQLQVSKCRIQDKEFEIEKAVSLNQQLETRFRKDLQDLSYIFSTKLQECSTLLLHRVVVLTQRLLKLIQDVEIVKSETVLKSDSSARLLQSMENLRLESLESSKLINELKRENCNLKSIQLGNDRVISDLNNALQRQELENIELKKQRDEFEKDAKQGAMIIAQKAAANEELARDVVKANQMLVSFNHLLDTKNQEIEKLKSTLTNQEKILQDHSQRYHQLYQQFEEYKSEFNLEKLEKVSQDLFAANRKMEEIEKVNRETAKLNELLTRKLASGDFGHRNFHH